MTELTEWGDPRLPERFWSKTVVTDECWLWTACTDSDGYGRWSVKRIARKAHRIAYERLVGPIPDGLELDHVCRVRACVNPQHLDPITHTENVRRGEVAEVARNKTTCRKGLHRWPEDAVIRNGKPKQCGPCEVVAQRVRYSRKKARDAASK